MISGKQLKPGTVSYLALNADVLTAPHIASALANNAAPIAFGTQRLTLVADPEQATDAATKAYVDATAQGLDVKVSVRAYAPTNVDFSGLATIDGVVLVAGDRVLLANQTNASENGIRVVGTGAWARSTDANSAAKLSAGTFTFVEEGALFGNSGWVLTNSVTTLGTTGLTFTQFSGAGTVIAGSGLAKTGNTLSVDVINDTQHGTRLGGALHAVATTAISGFMSAADKLYLDSVPGLLGSSDTSTASAIAAETTARANAIAAEVTARNTAIGVETDARVAADGVLNTAITAEVTARTAAVTGENTARTAAVNTLTDSLATEAAARTAADGAEAGTRAAAITTEAGTRAAAITTEATARADAITAEATARQTADTLEVNIRGAAITNITNLVATEATDRADAVTVERNARLDADAALTLAISGEVTARQGAITTEVSDRNAAIAALSTTVSGQTLFPRLTNRGMAASLTAADGAQACSVTLAVTPVLDGYVDVTVNGIGVVVSGDTSGACYFGTASGTAHSIANIAVGDKLFWNGSVAGFELATDDVISFAVFA